MFLIPNDASFFTEKTLVMIDYVNTHPICDDDCWANFSVPALP